ncbi:MAG: transcription termination/antitermination protein NusA [Holophagaceae bacterium]|nr:transcription termination/antitermination protein NusA [Holophagaceae bacterium]
MQVSRTDPRLLIKLFENEVPEIHDGTVVIRNCVREAGDRAKVAVHSLDPDVDPVGACVGLKGSRVQAIIRELKNEKIDIVRYSDDPAQFIANALNPAKAIRVNLGDPEGRRVEVVVDDEQPSVAIGKRGQNVRLAAKLTGWNIDVRSEADKRREAEVATWARPSRKLLSRPSPPRGGGAAAPPHSWSEAPGPGRGSGCNPGGSSCALAGYPEREIPTLSLPSNYAGGGPKRRTRTWPSA